MTKGVAVEGVSSRTVQGKQRELVKMFKSKSFFMPAALLLVSGGALLMPRQANAVVPCTPPLCASEYTQLMNNIQLVTQYAKQVDQYKKQIEQYQTQLKQYQQMYIKGSIYKAAPGFRANVQAQFPARGLNDGLEALCGNGKRKNPVAVEQYNNCVASVQTRNRRYNVVRTLLQDVAQNDADLAAASAERAALSAEDQGALQANTNKIAAINAKLQNDLQNARYTIDAYNAVLANINDDTVARAKIALGNADKLTGEVVQGLALKAGLRAARSRDR